MLSVVTGAGSGIGRACAELLAERGSEVLCVGRRPEELQGSVTRLGGAGAAVPANVTTEEGIARVVSTVAERPVQALVHAAGRESVTTLATTSRPELGAVLATNVVAPFFLTQQLLPRLAEAAGVVFVGSQSALSGRDRHAAYGASKAALIGLTKNLAVELAPRVRVNASLQARR